MDQQPYLLSTRLNQVLLEINSLHRFHGLTILGGSEPQSCSYKGWIIISRTAVLLQMILFLIGSLPAFSSNRQVEFMVCGFALLMSLEIIFQELVFVAQKKDVIELVRWCHQVETTQYSICVRPRNWFDGPREKCLKLVKLYVFIAIFYIFIVYFFMVPILSWINNHLSLPYNINIKGYEEKEHYWVFSIEFFIGLCGTFVIAQLFMYSLSFFILFSSYLIAQFELVARFVSEVPMNDEKAVTIYLSDIIDLHLDALQ